MNYWQGIQVSEISDASNKLKIISDEVLQCSLCALGAGRKNAVPGEGSALARMVIVGEGPGAQEDDMGRPFVGRSGKLLDEIIASHGGISRRDIFITNVVKCRPPGNRTPTPSEIETCKRFLTRQLDALRPKVILCLGATAALALTGQQLSLSRLRGRNLSGLNPAIVVTYHPSYGLRMGESIVKLMAYDFALAARFALEN